MQTKAKSKLIDDYEVLIRRRSEDDYSSFCPQLNYQINGNSHEVVEQKMKDYILKYIETLD